MEAPPQQKEKISSVEASKRFGITNTYVTLLCRRGLITGEFIGRVWYVDPRSLETYLSGMREAKERRRAALSSQLKTSHVAQGAKPRIAPPPPPPARSAAPRRAAFALAALFLVLSVALAAAAPEERSLFLAAHELSAANLAQIQSPFFANSGITLDGVAAALSNFFSGWFTGNARPAELARQVPPAFAPAPAPPTPSIAPATTTIIENTYPVIERTVERDVPTAAAGVSEDELAQKLQQLGNAVQSQLAGITSGSGGAVLPYSSGFAIDQLDGTKLTNVTVDGVSGLTAAEIPTDIVAADYLPLAGGTLAGALDAPALTASTTDYGALTAADASTTLLSNFGTAYFGGTATSTFDGAGDLALSGTLTAASTTATSTFDGGLAATGYAALATTTVAGALTVDGNATLAAATTTSLFIRSLLSGPSAAIGGLTATNTLAVYNAASFGATATSTFSSTGFLTLPSGLLSLASSTIGSGNQTGGLTVSGGATTTGDQYIAGSLTVGGASTVIGASPADALTVNSGIDSSLIPGSNKTYDLGSPSYYWRDAYVSTLNANNLSAASTSIGGTTNASFTINSGNSTPDTQNMQLIFFRGTVVPNAVLSWDSSLARFEFNQPAYISNQSGSTTQPTFTLQGVAGQTGNLLSLASSTGANVFAITGTGGIVSTSTTNATNFWQVLNSAGSPLLDLDTSNMRVGIGTTSPFATLSVNGSGFFGGTITASNITATGTLAVSGLSTLSTLLLTGSTTLQNFSFLNATGTAATTTSLYAATANIGSLSIGGTATSTFSSTGFLTLPTGLLSLASSTIGNGTQAGGLTVSGGATTTGNAYFAANIQIGSQPLVGSNRFSVGNTYAFAVAPDFGGAGEIPANSAFMQTTNNGNMVFTSTNGGMGVLQLAYDTSGNTWRSALEIANTTSSADSNLLLLKSGYGNVGIGTTSPFATLSVAGNGFFNGTLTASNISATGTLNVSGNSTLAAATSSAFAITGTVNALLSTNASGSVIGTTIGNGLTYSGGALATSFGTTTANAWTALQQFQNASSSLLSVYGPAYFGGTATSTFDSAGDLTLNGSLTANGAATLSNATTTSLFVKSLLSSPNATIGALTATNTLAVYNSASFGATATSTFTSTGWLGIGTTSPFAQLSVNPNGISGPAFAIGSSTATDFVVTNSGNVGIGTTNPATLLTVNGTTTVNNQVVANIPTYGTVNQQAFISSGGYGGGFAFNDTNFAGVFDYSSGSHMVLYSGQPSGATLGSISTGASKIDISGGSLGIGVAPTSNLTVNGNASIGGSYTGIAAPSNGLIIQGNVGIGTSSPTQLLDVGNSGQFTVNSGGALTALSATIGAGNLTLVAICPGCTSTAGNPAGTYLFAGSYNNYNYYQSGIWYLWYNGSTWNFTDTLGGYTDGQWLLAGGTIPPDSASWTTAHGASGTLTTASGAANSGLVTITSTGSVGIGTTSPATTLSVQGNGLFSGNVTLANLTATGTLQTNGLLSFASSTIGNGTQNGGLTISGGATTTGQAYFSGNVGIGTTSPANTLSIANSNGPVLELSRTGFSSGDLQISAGSTYGLINSFGTVSINTNNNGSNAFSADTAGRVTLGNVSAQSTNTLGVGGKASIGADYYNIAAPTNGLIVESSLGVGTTSPYAQLSIAGSAGGTTNLFAISTSTSGFATSTALYVSQNGNLHLFGNGAGEAIGYSTTPPGNGLIVSGNVGIGTTSPLDALSIYSSGPNVADFNSTSGSNMKIMVNSVTGHIASVALQNNYANEWYLSNTPSNSNSFNLYNSDSNGSAVVLTALQSGNVGIGTTSPSSLLALDSSSNSNFLTLSSEGNGQWDDINYLSKNSNGSANDWVAGPGINANNAYQVASGSFTTPNALFSLFSNGGVSIGGSYAGTTAPSNGLIVSGSVGIGTTSPQALLGLQGGIGVNSSQLYLAANGNVGIGSNAPNSTLQIVGNTTNSNVVSARGDGAGTYSSGNWSNVYPAFELNNANSTPGNVEYLGFSGNPSGSDSALIGAVNERSGSGSNGDLFFWTRNSDGTSGTRMWISQNGNVGIGTTSPWAQLSVNPNGVSGPAFAIGSSTATDFVVTNSGNVGIGTNSPNKSLVLNQKSTTDGFQFTGTSISGNSSGTGFLMALGYNLSGNKQLWLGDVDGAGNSAYDFARFGVYNNAAYIDAIRGDNSQNAVLGVGDTNSGVTVGSDFSTVSPSAVLWVNGNETIGAGYKTLPGNIAPTNGLAVQGSVGIGTTSPATTLSVQGNGLFSGNLTAASITATGTVSLAGLTDYASSTIGNGNQNGGLTISGGATTTGNAYFGGNVGVGTESPGTNTAGSAAILQVAGNILSSWNGTSAMGVQDTTGNFATLEAGTSGSAFTFSNTGFFAIGDSSTLANAYNPTIFEMITNAGSVGIGTTSPATTLSVQGNGLFSGNVTLANLTATGTLQTNGLLSLASSTIGNGNQNGGLTISGGATTTGNAYFGANVGVGTQSPDDALTINGNLDFSGSGGTTTISVQNVSSKNAPALAFQGSSVLSGNDNGGNIFFTAGSGNGTGASGYISFISGNTQTSSGNGGDLNLDAGQNNVPNSVNNSANRGGNINLNAGNVDASGGQSYASGGAINLTSGSNLSTGGSMSANGGNGGNIAVTLGSGGFSSNGYTGGTGGSFSVTGGAGGTTNYNGGMGGTGSSLTFTSGAGGNSSGGSGTRIGGNSGNIVFQIGTPGTGATSNGSYGTFQFLSGSVGIGTTTPYSELTVWGPDAASSTSAFAVVNNASTTVFSVFDGGNAQLSGTLTQSSDQRLKQNIQSLDASDTLALIDQLNPVSFQWIDNSYGSGPQVGFIAQQVEQIFPELVATTSPTALTPNGTLGLNYIGLIAPIVSALQALYADVQNLEQTVSGFAQSFTSSTITANNELCVGSTCVTPAQFQAMVAAYNASQASNGAANNTGNQSQPAAQPSQSSGSSTPESVTQNAASSSPQTGSSQTATDTPPVIQINGDNPAVIHVGDSYNDLGATITGPQQDLNLGIHTFLNGTEIPSVTIDTSAPATDTIAYVVTDQSGLTATSTRTVIIEPIASPSIVSAQAASTTATSTAQ